MIDHIQHTPSPWVVSYNERRGKRTSCVITSSVPPYVRIAVMQRSTCDHDARLIAMAPELLRSCQLAYVILKDEEGFNANLAEHIKTLINKLYEVS